MASQPYDTGLPIADLHAAVLRAHNLKSITYTGLVVSVPDTQVKGFFASAQTLSLLPNATWYVGFDQFSKELIALPRLGHTGWIPVAKCVCDATTITELTPIDPVLPVCRIPRTVAKIETGEQLNVLVLGSSLAQSMAAGAWAPVVFSNASSDYKLSDSISVTNYALGGAPNQYQLAQTGIISRHSARNLNSSGYPLTLTNKKPPNGRAKYFSDYDLVVLTCLANGGHYRLECIEPIIRNLRKQDIEVIVVTDNAQNNSGSDFIDLSTIESSDLYVDGKYVRQIAENYGVQFADTAAYVAESTLRYGQPAIYSDTIHMQVAGINGATGQPASGHEVWARAIRSVIPLFVSTVPTPVPSTYDFNSGVPNDWISYSGGILSTIGGALAVEHANGDSIAGVLVNTPAALSGDVFTVTGTISFVGGHPEIRVGGQGGGSGWSSNNVIVSSSGAFTATVTLNRDVPIGQILFAYFIAPPDGSNFTLDDIIITHQPLIPLVGTPVIIEGVGFESTSLPESRVVSDLKTPGDSFVILPNGESYVVSLDANAGTLMASPVGAFSFAARADSSTGASEQVLELGVGKKATIGGQGAVAFALVYVNELSTSCTFDVYKNNALIKSITITAGASVREVYLSILSPDEHGKSSTDPSNETVEIRVTAGSIKIAALVCQTSDQEFILPEQIDFVGTWTDKTSGGGGGALQGMATDTQGDYAVVRCPETGRRLSWVISSRPDSKTVNTWSASEQSLNTSTSGVSHIKTVGNHVGSGQFHYIDSNETLTPAGSATNGYGLHIGGAIIVNDR